MTEPESRVEIPLRIDPERAGTYFTLPFQVPDEVERMTIEYRYPRYDSETRPLPNGAFISRTERNIIDIGLIGPDGRQRGASGSDKTSFSISETEATPGYRACALVPGEWRVLVGAYRVQPEGVDVAYTIRFEFKKRRLFLGDLHAHTLASDGVHTAAELAIKAKRAGLDFVAITDHNQTVGRDELAAVGESGVTLIPGVEWTHYAGHANFLGAERDFEIGFAVNAEDEIRARFRAARDAGLTIGINHPFDEGVPFRLDQTALPYDYVEVWNGPMRMSNLRAIAAWNQLLLAGKRIPAWGGSDYHRDTPFSFLGGPTVGVYAGSRGVEDLLAAIRAGSGFITFEPSGPTIDLSAGDVKIGGCVSLRETRSVHLSIDRLKTGDTLRILTPTGAMEALTAGSAGSAEIDFPIDAPGFVRAEIYRTLIPGVPPLPVLISNPIWVT